LYFVDRIPEDSSQPFFGVSRLTMTSNGQYQHGLFRGQPAVLGNVAITAAQQNEFTTPVFGSRSESARAVISTRPIAVRVVCELYDP
jgi:hypothetical protein